MATIVGIHGLANKPLPDVEKAGWIDAIKEGLSKNCDGFDPGALDFHLVYWASFMYRYALHRDAGYPMDSHFDDEPYIEALPRALKRHDDGILDAALRTFGNLADIVTDRVAEEHAFDWATGPLTERLLKDLQAYYSGKKVRDAQDNMRPARDVICEGLAAKLKELRAQGREIILISHSMGTIIAYDVLRDLCKADPGFAVQHLITLGSPLGLSYVKTKVANERGERRSPTAVRGTWVNFADRNDPVSLDTHLSDDYGANAGGIRVRDDVVANDYVGERGRPNPHKIYGYLRTPEFSEHLKSLL